MYDDSFLLSDDIFLSYMDVLSSWRSFSSGSPVERSDPVDPTASDTKFCMVSTGSEGRNAVTRPTTIPRPLPTMAAPYFFSAKDTRAYAKKVPADFIIDSKMVKKVILPPKRQSRTRKLWRAS